MISKEKNGLIVKFYINSTILVMHIKFTCGFKKYYLVMLKFELKNNPTHTKEGM
jgi:hypothetical protein